MAFSNEEKTHELEIVINLLHGTQHGKTDNIKETLKKS